ncbi:hypothetical protein M422DRAFT_266771 [Sphaerobolus stellatus SS14]|uniref:Uncharacterized protein n=1 Tax=Sphaerobolus stellatus (strain SS14) TaxID=990650 RepID=A0A0C9UQY3_SPHS4|nr:hypothetical protein M422DRAFT_266771 [Sphaerobolus stellatus SS14]
MSSLGSFPRDAFKTTHRRSLFPRDKSLHDYIPHPKVTSHGLPAAPALFLCFAAMVCVSAPTWERISFLNVNQGGQTIYFGVFGYTGTAKRVGYFFDSTRLGLPGNTNLNNDVIHNLTFVLILHLTAASLAGPAVLFGLCGTAYSRIGMIFMTLTATLAGSPRHPHRLGYRHGPLGDRPLPLPRRVIGSCGNNRRRRAAAPAVTY